MVCKYEDEPEIHPFAYRTHAHNLGVVISGYKWNQNSRKWDQIGKMDPKLPEMFYPVDTQDLVIRNGDQLVARCTMVWIAIK